MFDCPEQIQTSPISTSSNEIVLLPLTVSVWGPPYSVIGSSRTSQAPSAAVAVVFAWPAIDTVTSSPGSALPQTRFAMPCWSTMWLPNIALSETSARVMAGSETAAARQMTNAA